MPDKILYVILWGDFENGYELIGTFEHPTDAIEYAEDHLRDATWEVIMLQKPAKEPAEL